jgi:hypothetical protein
MRALRGSTPRRSGLNASAFDFAPACQSSDELSVQRPELPLGVARIVRMELPGEPDRNANLVPLVFDFASCHLFDHSLKYPTFTYCSLLRTILNYKHGKQNRQSNTVEVHNLLPMKRPIGDHVYLNESWARSSGGQSICLLSKSSLASGDTKPPIESTSCGHSEAAPSTNLSPQNQAKYSPCGDQSATVVVIRG